MKSGRRLLALATTLIVATVVNVTSGQQFQCTNEGFFVDPNDCSKFIRCVDTYQTGRFQVYTFDCPDGKYNYKDNTLSLIIGNSMNQ